MLCTLKIYRCVNVASSGIRHDCPHADIIIVFTRTAINNELPLWRFVRNNCTKLFVMAVMPGKLCALASRASRREIYLLMEKRWDQNARVHLQDSCRYKRSTPCSRPRPARRAGREVSRIASRTRHPVYSTCGSPNLSLKMRLPSASPPFRKSPCTIVHHPLSLHPEASLRNLATRETNLIFLSRNSPVVIHFYQKVCFISSKNYR